MELEEEIIARIRAALAWDKDAKLSDFQLKAAENGSVLINLKTRRAQLIYDDDSELHDWADLLGDKPATGAGMLIATKASKPGI